MKLNFEVDPRIELLLTKNKPLSNWFKKNLDTMVYFDLTHPGCVRDESNCHHDIVVLSRMADVAYKWLLTTQGYYSEEDIVNNACKGISTIYANEVNSLSENAQELFCLEANTKARN